MIPPKMIFAPLAITLCVSGTLLAQTLEFEVASVKPAPPQADGHISTRMSTDDGMLNYSNVTLNDVIAQAFGMAQFQIAGPAWLDSDRYVIAAKIPPGAPANGVPLMLQSLLKDRFGIEFHRESKELSVLALVVAKGGPKLKAVDTNTGCHGEFNRRLNSLDCHISLPNLAEQLSRHTDRPVVDKTMLKGPFEITLHWLPEGALPDDSAGAATLLEALPEQLGLKLEAQHAPVEILVVDSASRTPTAN